MQTTDGPLPVDGIGELPARVNLVVAILTWRGYGLARSCLESLTASTSSFATLVVDNGSGTGEGERLAAEFGHTVTAVTLAENGGVPAGYNAALRWAKEAGASHVLLLNNDTLLSDVAMIDRLLDATSPNVAAVGPVIHRADETVQSAGGRIRWGTGRASHLAEHDIPSIVPYEAEWLDGSCVMVSLAAAGVIGGFAEEFFMYWEEVDWCVRAWRAGFRCLVQPAASITHFGSASVTNETQIGYWFRNKLLFMRRNASASANAATLLAFLVRTVPNQLRRQGFSVRGWAFVLRAGWSALSWNVRDAVRLRRWRCPADGPSI